MSAVGRKGPEWIRKCLYTPQREGDTKVGLEFRIFQIDNQMVRELYAYELSNESIHLLHMRCH